jgi:hypothetical protein
MRQVDVDPGRFRDVAELLAEFPDLDVDRVRALLETSAQRRRRPEPIRPRSWSEVTAAVECGWVTKNEARKYAGLAQRRGPTPRQKGGRDAG